MKRHIRSTLTMIAAAALGLVTACGGGSSTSGSPPPPTPQIVMKIGSMPTGTAPLGSLIGSIDISGTLPTGVSLRTVPDTVNPSKFVPASGMVTVSGVAAGVNTAPPTSTYDPGTRSLSIIVANPNGFSEGEFVTVICDIVSSGTHTDYTVTNFQAVDVPGGQPISNLTWTFSVTTR